MGAVTGIDDEYADELSEELPDELTGIILDDDDGMMTTNGLLVELPIGLYDMTLMFDVCVLEAVTVYELVLHGATKINWPFKNTKSCTVPVPTPVVH